VLGWHVSVYRQADGGHSPATPESAQGVRLAVWQTDVGGLDWLRDLAKEGKAIDLGGNGYPSWFTAPAEHLIPRIEGGSLRANEDWVIGEGSYIADPKLWVGKTQIEPEAVKQCRPDEWLLIEIWDES